MSTLSRRDFLKVASVSSTALAALCLTGCGSKENGSAAVEETVPAATINEDASVYEQEQAVGFIAPVVNVVSGDPGSFLPLKPNGGKCSLNEVYEPLFDQDGPAGDLYCVIGKDFRWDGNDLYVELCDTVYDSEGNHYTAHDVVWYYKAQVEEGYNSQKYADNFDDVEALDDYNVVFHAKPDKADVFLADNNLFRGACLVTQKAFPIPLLLNSALPTSTPSTASTPTECSRPTSTVWKALLRTTSTCVPRSATL